MVEALKMPAHMDVKRAKELKEEGNLLFAAKKLEDALERYSLAIELDNTHAVYFANRAACHIGLGRFEKAVDDAENAIRLDKAYAKGWARLATAHEKMKNYHNSIRAYRKALKLLPSESLTPAQQIQKEAYTEGITRCEAQFPVHQTPISMLDQMPWIRAAELLPELRAAGVSKSSAYIIHDAYMNWSTGISKMKQTTQFRGADGAMQVMGPGHVNVDLSNAIMLDRRVIHISDAKFQDWIQRQFTMEIQQFNGWFGCKPEQIIREAKQRLASNGWDDVRRALSVTIRTMFFVANITAAVQDRQKAIQGVEDVLAVLDEGRKLWQNVSRDDRGVIFSDTFVRGVRAFHMEAYFGACASELEASDGSETPKYPLSKLMHLAQYIIDDVRASSRPNTTDDAFNTAFYDIPLGEALAVKGFCYRKMAKHCSESQEEAEAFLAKCADSYYEAAHCFPEDDEKRCFHILNSLKESFRIGQPLEVTLPRLEEMRLGVPKMKRIWEVSQLQMAGRHAEFQNYILFEEGVRESLEKKELTMESQVTPQAEMLGEL